MPFLAPTIRLPTLRCTSALVRSHHGSRPRPFSSTEAAFSKPLPPRRVILDSEIEENFLKGSGPGGQKINKTSSAVQLKHLATGMVVKCQDTRSRSLNRKTARRLLGERLEELELGEGARTRVKAKEKGKKKASADKKKRRKYKALEEGKAGGMDETLDEDHDEGGDSVETPPDEAEDIVAAPHNEAGDSVEATHDEALAKPAESVDAVDASGPEDVLRTYYAADGRRIVRKQKVAAVQEQHGGQGHDGRYKIEDS